MAVKQLQRRTTEQKVPGSAVAECVHDFTRLYNQILPVMPNPGAPTCQLMWHLQDFTAMHNESLCF